MLLSVFLSHKNLTQIPLNFKKVTGHFYCDNNQLTSLQGCPKVLGGSLYSNNNQIWTFQGVGLINRSFYCENNPIEIIWNFFKLDKSKWKSHMRFIDVVNTYETLFPSPKIIDGDTLEQIADDLNITLPSDNFRRSYHYGNWREQLERAGYQVL